MKDQRANISSIYMFGRYMAAMALAAVFTSVMTEPISARQARSRPGAPGRNAYEDSRARDRDMQDRATRLERMTDWHKSSANREQLLAFAQIKEDFERLQVVNKDKIRVAKMSETIDYKQLSSATAEINKRAKRLKSNLAIPVAEDETREQERPPASDNEQMKTSLTKLDDLVVSFATNPYFQNLRVYDARNAGKASCDLDRIIELSNRIKKNAEKLGKASQMN
jgi:hypothetical protein